MEHSQTVLPMNHMLTGGGWNDGSGTLHAHWVVYRAYRISLLSAEYAAIFGTRLCYR